jgi:hypothetical protein
VPESDFGRPLTVWLSGPSSRCHRPARRRRGWNLDGTQPPETPRSRPRNLETGFAGRRLPAREPLRGQAGCCTPPIPPTLRPVRFSATSWRRLGTRAAESGNNTLVHGDRDPPTEGYRLAPPARSDRGGRGPAKARAETEVARPVRELELSADDPAACPAPLRAGHRGRTPGWIRADALGAGAGRRLVMRPSLRGGLEGVRSTARMSGTRGLGMPAWVHTFAHRMGTRCETVKEWGSRRHRLRASVDQQGTSRNPNPPEPPAGHR